MKVLEQTFLSRAVIIGGNDECRIGSALFGLASQGDGFVGGVGAGSSHDETASFCLVDGLFDDSEVFLVREGGGLSGGSDRNDSGDTGCDLTFDESRESVFVEIIVLEGGNECGVGAFEHGEGGLWGLVPENDGAVAANEDAAGDVITKAASEGEPFAVAAEAEEVFGRVEVFHADDLLFDDGAFVELGSGVMAGCADEFYAAFVGTLVGVGADERW